MFLLHPGIYLLNYNGSITITVSDFLFLGQLQLLVKSEIQLQVQIIIVYHILVLHHMGISRYGNKPIWE